MIKNIFYKFLFFALLFFQTYSIATLNLTVNAEAAQAQSSGKFIYLALSNFKLDIFSIIVIVSIILMFFQVKNLKNEHVANRRLITGIIIYSAYQAVIIIPLSYLDKQGSMKETFVSIVPRFSLLLIPLFLWSILPSFKKVGKVFTWVNLSALGLVIASFYNYSSGNFFTTNTGQVRFLSAGAPLVFAFVFVCSFFIRDKKFQHYIFMLLSLLGMVMANYRAAYFLLFAVFVGGLFVFIKQKAKLKPILSSLAVIGVVFVLFSQYGEFWGNFSQRLKSTSFLDENAQVRLDYWGLSFERFKDSPLNGSMAKNEFYRSMYVDEYPAPHSFIFEILSTQGIVGLIFILYFMVQSIVIAYRNRADESSLQMLLSLTFLILYSSFNPTFLNPWVLLTMIVQISVILFRNQFLNNDKKMLN